MKVKFQIITDGCAPVKAHDSDAAWDIRAAEDATVPSQGQQTIKAGFKMELPLGYAGFVMSRSGLAAKFGIQVLNSPGLIDAGYRGEIMVILGNRGSRQFEVKKGDRIGQLLIFKLAEVEVETSTALTSSDRGEAGIGSTGVL